MGEYYLHQIIWSSKDGATIPKSTTVGMEASTSAKTEACERDTTSFDHEGHFARKKAKKEATNVKATQSGAVSNGKA